MLRSSMIEINYSSVLVTFVDNNGKPLRYHRNDSVVVFRYYQHLMQEKLITFLLNIIMGHIPFSKVTIDRYI